MFFKEISQLHIWYLAQHDDSPNNDHMCFEPKKMPSFMKIESPTTTRNTTNFYYTSESSTISREQTRIPGQVAASHSNDKPSSTNNTSLINNLLYFFAGFSLSVIFILISWVKKKLNKKR